MIIRFTVYGRPVPQGSMRGFVRGGKVAITSDNKKLRPWRQQVTETAIAECIVPSGDAVAVDAVFYFAKPKSAKKRVHHTVKPDGDKLMRSLLDALTGVAYNDDAEVVGGSWLKRYDAVERAEITITELSPRQLVTAS